MQQKHLHAGLQTAALVLALLGVTAAFQSHNLKRPTPFPNLYSPHSFMGMFVLCLALVQVSRSRKACCC